MPRINEELFNTFVAELTKEYADRFQNDPEYAYSAAKITPLALAVKMSNGVIEGTASFGPALKSVCRRMRINPTFKAMRATFTI